MQTRIHLGLCHAIIGIMQVVFILEYDRRLRDSKICVISIPSGKRDFKIAK